MREGDWEIQTKAGKRGLGLPTMWDILLCVFIAISKDIWMEGMPKVALFLAMNSKWELRWPLFLLLLGLRTTLWHPPVLSSSFLHRTWPCVLYFWLPKLWVPCIQLSFFLPAVKFSSIQQTISKTCHEPNTATGAFKVQYVWTPVPALQSSANDRQIKDH